MSENVARSYAEALMDVAEEANKIDAIAKDLTTVENAAMAHDGMLNAALSSPVFSAEERENVLKAVLPKLGLDTLTNNLLLVVNANKRFSVFPLIRARYNALADERAGRVRVKVTTADPLTPTLENEIKEALESSTGKTVLVEHSIDTSLIAGMVARVGGTVYDSSLRTRLEQLEHSLVMAQA